MGFEYLQRRRLHNPSGQSGAGLCHLQSKEVLPLTILCRSKGKLLAILLLSHT